MTIPETLPLLTSFSLHLLSRVHLFYGQRMAVQIVDGSVKMAFYKDRGPGPAFSLKGIEVQKIKVL